MPRSLNPQQFKKFVKMARTMTEEVINLFDAQAAGCWLIDSDTSTTLLAESLSIKSLKTTSPWRRQILGPTHQSVPLKYKFFVADHASQVMKAFALKSSPISNALIIPLGQTDRRTGVVVILNIPHWDAAQQHLATYLAAHLNQDWQWELQIFHQQRQIEEMTDQSRQWQAIYTGVKESIVLLNLKGIVLTVNPATEHITGHTADQAIGRHIGELFPKVGPMGSGINYPGPSGFYQTLKQRRPSDLFEAVVETKDKRHIWVNYTYTPLWDGNGKMIGLVRVTSDVSTIKNIEQMKNDFVSIASHELRTPLGVINGYLNLFLNGQLGTITQDQRTFIERIFHSSTDMSTLVEDLLNISRIEAGRLEVSVQSFDLDKLIQEVIGHLEPRYQAKSIRIRYKASPELIRLRADRNKLERALTNIIDNAIKYTYDGGTITIATQIKNDTVAVTIKDSGVGIKPEHIGHIFEKFYRENNPLSIKEGGSGLGLYISRKLVELHGGTITAASQPPHGSTFTLTLPFTAKKHP